MSVAAPQSNSSQNHKENQGEDQQHWKEIACWNIKQTRVRKLHNYKEIFSLRYIKNRVVSLWLVTGPLSTLPPEPFWSHRGGAQPASQWQLWLLLHSWWKSVLHLLKLPGKGSYSLHCRYRSEWHFRTIKALQNHYMKISTFTINSTLYIYPTAIVTLQI